MIRDASWRKVCPKTMTNVDGEQVKYAKRQRKHVTASLSSSIIPLLLAGVDEKIAEKAKEEKKEKAKYRRVSLSHIFVSWF
jgi:hypothetical protein